MSCHEIPQRAPHIKRRIRVEGLKDSTVRFCFEKGYGGATAVTPTSDNGVLPEGEGIQTEEVHDRHGDYLEVKHITGGLVFAW